MQRSHSEHGRLFVQMVGRRLGAIVFASALWVFRVSHKALGRNWSISLEIREQHSLVSSGPYALVRHPMYTSFLLMGIGQALLLSNWIVGLAGLVGFAILFFLRVDKEEHMMLANFGPQYRAYMERTKRIIPYLYQWSNSNIGIPLIWATQANVRIKGPLASM